jgi:two-component system CheB/CheR fusion protein
MAARLRSKAPGKKTPPDPTMGAPSACVAIAAAGRGTEDLAKLFAAVPAGTRAAFVVALANTDGASIAGVLEALAAATTLPVELAVEGGALAPDRIYLVDNGDLATVEAGRLRVRPASPGDGRIDSLLVSVAEAYEECAVVVVLNGLGADGVTGVACTKRCGGLSIAEGSDESLEPEAQAVTAAGIADMRLELERIAGQITAYVNNLIRTEEGEGPAPTVEDDSGAQIARIATILRNATGNDFHGYKHATFRRRIQRRMQVVQVNHIDRYIERLRSDPAEVHHLFQDLLIGVTQFFRDPAEFEVLEQQVMPALFDGKGGDDRIRLWVLGCATGEEAYSLAILLREQMAAMDVAPHVQIFATDIDARALAVARSGRYPDSIARHVSPERLARWFVKEGATYSVVKELREMCIFSPHNLIKDAPFSRIDLLSCRNLLIYLNSELQDRVIPIFHFSLKPGGYLFLGPAENVTRHQKLFTPIDRKNRIFRRHETPVRVLPNFPLTPRASRADDDGETPARAAPPRPISGRLGRRVEAAAERYAPAYVMIDENYDVLHFSGRTGRFLEPATGAASLNLLNLVQRDLRLDLRNLLHKALGDGEKHEARNVRMTAPDGVRSVNLVVEPIAGESEGTVLMVLFQDFGPAAETGLAGEPAVASDELVQRLESELRLHKERLQTTIEELESTNEELKSSNEEYQSINEELQSANEELETSKEELQAVNEELQTVNGELAHRVSDLGRINSDLKNLLESTQIATLFLDNDLRLRSFTPAAQDVFHLIEADVGRPIAHVAARVVYPELQDDARKVLKSLGQVERTVTGEEERIFLTRVLPYRSVDNFIAGVVVTFLDATTSVRAENALRRSERRFSEAQELAGVGVWEWNLDTDQTWWSPVVYQLWSYSPSEPPPPHAERRVHPDDREAYDAALEEARETGVFNAEWRVVLPDGSVRWLADSGRVSASEEGRRMLGVTQDVTSRKQTENRLTLLLGELQHRVRNILGVVRSIVGRTVRSSDTVEDLAAHLDGRLNNLARTQGVFTRSGAEAIDLEELVVEEMVAVAARDDQVTIEGPEVRLRRHAAETFGLALHELATNAVKYGALADGKGRLSITWGVVNTSTGPRLSLEWRESAVRALDVAPMRTGFGRELIEKGLPYELGAMTSLEFARGGVRARIELPLNETVAELNNPSSMEDAL